MQTNQLLNLTGGESRTATKDYPWGLLPYMKTKEERIARLIAAGLLKEIKCLSAE